MDALGEHERRAFHDLRRRLMHRRYRQLEPRLRIELGLLAILIAAFLFWQVRGPLAALRLHGGAPAALAAWAAAWGLLCVTTAALVAVRHARRLRSGPPGPEWLSLPVTGPALATHLEWDSRILALWAVVPAVGVWTAGLGVLPFAWWALLSAPMAWLLIEAGKRGASLGSRVASRLPGRVPRLHGVAATLGATATRPGGRALQAAGWGRSPAWLTLARKDLVMTRRVAALGRQALVALVFWILSALVWNLPEGSPAAPPGYFLAFALSLLGAAALGQWLVALSGSDPFDTLRTLPVGLPTLWGARFLWALVGAAALVVGHAGMTSGLSSHAERVFLVWVSAATLGIAALAVNYGLTLFPRADLAQRLLGLSLGLAVAASLMIPLLGWLILLAALLHSTRRLPRWSRLEEA